MPVVIIKDIKQEDLEKMNYLEDKFGIKTRTKVLLKCLDMTYKTFKSSEEK